MGSHSQPEEQLYLRLWYLRLKIPVVKVSVMLVKVLSQENQKYSFYVRFFLLLFPSLAKKKKN